MDPTRDILNGLILPAAAAFVLMLAARPWRGERRQDPLVLSVAAIVSLLALWLRLGDQLWPMNDANDATDRLFLIIPAVFGIGAVASALEKRFIAWWAVMKVVVFVSIALIAWPKTQIPLPFGWSAVTFIGAIILAFIVTMLSAGATATLAWVRPGSLAVIVVAGMSLCAAGLVTFTGAKSLGDVGLIGGAMTLAFLGFVIWRRVGFSPAGVAAAAVVPALLMFCALERLWSSTPVWPTLIILASPAFALLATMCTRKMLPRKRFIVELLAAALPATAVMIFFAIKFASEYSAESPVNYGY